MPQPDLAAQLEAILFVANEPLKINRLADLTDRNPQEVKTALGQLIASRASSGLQVTQLEDTYRLVTAPQTGTVVRRYLEAETRSELSKPALETLAIIAYRGPLTKMQLDELRGVSSDTMLRNLLQRGLISEQGTAPEPGKPPLYGVTQAFLHHFGLSSVAQLPPLEDLSEA